MSEQALLTKVPSNFQKNPGRPKLTQKFHPFFLLQVMNTMSLDTDDSCTVINKSQALPSLPQTRFVGEVDLPEGENVVNVQFAQSLIVNCLHREGTITHRIEEAFCPLSYPIS